MLLLGRLVVAKEEELVVQDGSADGAAFLIAMEGGRRVRCAVAQLALLVEVLVGCQNIGAENAERIAMKLIAARFGDKADDAGSAALVGGRGVLRFDAGLFDAVLGNVERGNDGGDVVFGNAQWAAIDHVIDRSNDGAVDGVRGDIDAGTAAGDVLNGKGAGGVGCAIGRSNSGAELHKIEDIAREQRNAVDGFGGDQLAHGGVACVHQRS